MPHDQAEVVVSSSQHVTTWSTRVSSFQPVSTQNTQEGYTHLTGSTWNQGSRARGKTQGAVLSLPSVPSQKATWIWGVIQELWWGPHCTWHVSEQTTRVPDRGKGASILQHSSTLHSYTRGTLMGPDWQELEMTPSLKRAVLGELLRCIGELVEVVL